MTRKGISPLIATVLILGFTVALAAVIMIWGQSFTKKMQEATETTAQKQITCSTDVMLEIKHAEVLGNRVKLVIENGGSINIDKFNIRIYGTEGADSTETSSGLEAYGIRTFEVPFDLLKTGMTIEEIEIFPTITINDESFVYSSGYKTADIAYPPDILINGGFEDDFTMWIYKGDGPILITTTEVYEGIKALSLTSNAGGWTAAYQYIYPQNGFEKAYTYFLITKCKTNVGHSCKIFLGDDTHYGIYAAQNATAGTGNWETLYAHVHIPPEAPTDRIAVYVYGEAGGPGTSYYDSITLYKYKE
jgi:flagellin-like protein